MMTLRLMTRFSASGPSTYALDSAKPVMRPVGSTDDVADHPQPRAAGRVRLAAGQLLAPQPGFGRGQRAVVGEDVAVAHQDGVGPEHHHVPGADQFGFASHQPLRADIEAQHDLEAGIDVDVLHLAQQLAFVN